MNKFLPFLFLLFSVSLSFGQINATTSEGKHVLLNEDGTWEYARGKAEPVGNTAPDKAPVTSGLCDYKTNEIDEFTGVKKVIMKEQDLISHTPEEFKKYYRNQELTNAQVYCARVDDKKAVYINWKLNTESAYKIYGSIKSDSKFMVKLVSGDIVDLVFLKSNTGDSNDSLKYTTYLSYCLLGDESVQALQKSPVEKIRMYWSKGYKEYPVVEPNLFIDQLPCIE